MKPAQNGLEIKEYRVFKNIAYCIRHTFACYPALLWMCAALALLSVALPVLTTYLPKLVIDAVTGGGAPARLLITVCAFMLAVGALSAAKKYIEKYQMFRRFRMNAYFMRAVALKGMTTDYANQENEGFRRLQTEAFSACNGNYSPFTKIYELLVALFSSLFGFALFFGVLARLSHLLIAFLCLTTLAGCLVNRRVVRWISEHIAEKTAFQQRLNYINSAAEDQRSAKDIRLYNMAEWFTYLYAENMSGLSSWYARYAKKVFGVSVSVSALALARECAAYLYLIYMALEKGLSVADFVLYIGVVNGFSAWLSGIMERVGELDSINLAVNRFRAFLEYPEKYVREGGISASDMRDAPREIELADVSYRYPGAEDFALRHVNLKIAPGERLAVVGLNGAGKTTLVKLICGLTEPTEGRVLYNGVDVREYDRINFYKLFSAVFQQFSLLPVKICEIVSETPAESVDMPRVEACLALACLKDKIDSLPNGARSDYSRTIYDDGAELSGGELQKLLLARALYKNAPVIILDEPTAALDPIAESRLYERYGEIMDGKTGVFISHRLASTRFCDRIILIDNGEIIETGTHDTLLAKKGTYYELFETQAKYYRDSQENEL